MITKQELQQIVEESFIDISDLTKCRINIENMVVELTKTNKILSRQFSHIANLNHYKGFSISALIEENYRQLNQSDMYYEYKVNEAKEKLLSQLDDNYKERDFSYRLGWFHLGIYDTSTIHPPTKHL